MADTDVFFKTRQIGDFQQQLLDREIKQQLANAEIIKSMQVDVDKLGERAFMKAAQGIELTPQERAAAMVVDAKSGGIQFNPVTGTMMQKPRISDRIAIGGETIVPPSFSPPLGNFFGSPAPDSAPVPTPYDGTTPVPIPAPVPTTAPRETAIDKAFRDAMAQTAGNPKAQQSITEKYFADKVTSTEGESNAATFADRMIQSYNALKESGRGDTSGTKLSSKLYNVPLVGNYLVDRDVQVTEQAKRDFINAQLRRESGAVISQEEFENADKQYFAQPGDSKEVLARKAQNRRAALEGMIRSAGQSYMPSTTIIENETQPSPQGGFSIRRLD